MSYSYVNESRGQVNIFERSGTAPKQYILLSQACDLMVRSNGERTHSATTEGIFAELVKGEHDLSNHAELQYFDSSNRDKYFVSFKKVFTIKLFVLDFCATNENGNAEFILGQSCPKLLIPAWQNRWAHLNKLAEKNIAKYTEMLKKGVDPASAAILVGGCCNENKIKPTIDVTAKKLSYPLRRISRLRQPRAAALLARYANFIAREAFDHDFGTPSEEQKADTSVNSEAAAKSDSAPKK